MGMITRITAGGNVVLGGWLIAVPFVFGATGVRRWNDVLVGLVVVLVAGYNYSRSVRRRPLSRTGAGLVTILGTWLVVEPFIFGFVGPELWHNVVWGTIVASFGSYNAYVATLVGQTQPLQMATE